ncbi:MAG: DUF2709 domain-containing protein [Chlamydiota bacterium]
MDTTTISKDLKTQLLSHLKKIKSADLISTYLFFVQKKLRIQPILFPKEKMIYESLDTLISKLEGEGRLWHETEISIQFVKESVNEDTKKIYICPHTGKVFGDNTHPNPQDAIYDWVSQCPENKDRVGGLPLKRFFVSEDPEVIKSYIKERKSAIKKVVYSSVITGKLFHSKEAVLEDFRKNHIKKLSLFEVQNQNRFQIADELLALIQTHLTEEGITQFVESLSAFPEFSSYIKRWTG